MRILASTVMEDQNNPKLAFYRLLFDFFQVEKFDKTVARALAAAAVTHADKITMPEITFENLKLWHSQYQDQGIPGDPGVEKFENACGFAFADLASQMRNEAVRELLREWISGDDLYVHVRRSKSLGGGFASFTIIVDHEEAFREFMKDPEGFRGYVKWSETDPNVASESGGDPEFEALHGDNGDGEGSIE